jgi:hypothetical protein
VTRNLGFCAKAFELFAGGGGCEQASKARLVVSLGMGFGLTRSAAAVPVVIGGGSLAVIVFQVSSRFNSKTLDGQMFLCSGFTCVVPC